MLSDYLPILVLLVVVLVLVAGILIISHLIGPRRRSKEDLEPYESGVAPTTGAHLRFSIKYFVVAIMFIIFDIEVIFLFPWAVVYTKLLEQGTFIFVEMLLFLGILGFGLAYVWKKGALEWE